MQRGRLADLQAQQVEVGRIRMGTSTTKTSRAGKEYNEPVKLDRFRLTSRSEQLIQEASAVYGGDVVPWDPQSGGAQQWEVIITSPSIRVIVPPNPVSQWYEQWTAGKCTVRCDGVREMIEDRSCPCGPDPQNRRCKPTTRLALMLAEMNGIGVWRLETHGYYAAVELPAVADLLSAAGGNVPARLEMEERSAQVPNPREPGKMVTSRFMVPVLHVEATPHQLISTFGRPAIGAGPDDALPPPPVATPPALPAAPAATPADESPPGQSQDELKRQWMIMEQFEQALAGATTKERMLELKGKLETRTDLTDEFRVNMNIRWSDRAKAIASSPPAPAPATAPPPPPPATPPPVALDRSAVWRDLVALSGFKGLTMSQLKQRFIAWGQAEGELVAATAEQLQAFAGWLKAT